MSINRSQASAAAAAVRRRLGAEEGFGIIEVVVSALVVVLISIAVFAAIDAAGHTADSNKSRSAGSALAQADQERMRSMTVSDLIANPDTTRNDTVDGESYTVRSQASYVIDPADAGVTDCTSSERSPRYFKLTSTVSWPEMRGTSPVQEDSLRAIPNGSVEGLGSLAVGIQDRNGAGVPNVSVSLSGPQSATGTTNANGCLIFGYVKSGTYTLSFSKAGYVEAAYPNRSDITDSVVVAQDSLATKSYQYDQAAEVRVSYVTSAFNSTTPTAPIAGSAFTVANSGLGSVNTRTVTHATGTTFNSGNIFFPFTSAYGIWAGGCAENEPPSAFSQTVTVPAGGTSPATLREPRLRVQPRQYTNAAQTSSGTLTTARVVFYPATSGCTPNAVATRSTTFYDAPLPYGPYTACIQNKVNNPTATVTWTDLGNSAAAGTLYTASPNASDGQPYLPFRDVNAPPVSPCPT
jgi:Tfp pilus assembly protein PilV